MKSNRKILLPEKDNLNVLKAIKKCKSLDVELITEIEINQEWFNENNLDFNAFNNEQKVLINSFLALKKGVINGLIIGADYSSKDVFKSAIKYLRQSGDILSSCFVAINKKEYSIWGDCAFNIEPDQTVAKSNITKMIDMAKALQLSPINVALLSYSTNDSGAGKQVDFINDLSFNLKENFTLNNNINFTQNIQFDAAFNEQICTKKGLKFNKPNVVWFPNLMSGNIGYKIAQHYSKMHFAGPFILGTNYLVSDLSRGATVKDIELTIKIMAKLLSYTK